MFITMAEELRGRIKTLSRQIDGYRSEIDNYELQARERRGDVSNLVGLRDEYERLLAGLPLT